MKRRWISFLLVFCCLLGLLASPQTAQATTVVNSQLTFENLTAEIGRGFGNTWNRYAFSMAEFDQQVFVGTWNLQIDYPELVAAAQSGQLAQDLNLLAQGGNALKGIKYIASTGAEIWRHDSGQDWTRVHKAASEDTGFRQMLEYNGVLYAGSANSTTGTKLYASTDGVTWAVAQDFGPDNNSIRTMVTHGGKLFIGTENNETGGELWSFDGTSATREEVFSNDSSVAELAIYDGKMHVGTWDFTDGYNLYRQEGSGYAKVTPTFPGSNGLANLGVMKLIEFNTELYLGTVNYRDGFTLLKTSNTADTNSWQVISIDGLGDKDNAYTWSMVEWNGKLYLGTFNSGLSGGELDPLPIPLDGRAELWCSENGSDWNQVFDDGLGSPFTYGIRNMLVSNDKLYLGTAANFFIPDLLSELYNLDGFDLTSIDWSALNLGTEQLVQLEESLQRILSKGQEPFIGTQIFAAAPVPEPGTLLLLGAGLLCLVLYRRKGKN